jgi:hypothetical protein
MSPIAARKLTATITFTPSPPINRRISADSSAARPDDRERDRQFRKIIGYSDLAKLAVDVERDLTARRQSAHTPAKEDTHIPVTV